MGEGLILAIGKDGVAEIHKPEDYVEVKKEDMDLVRKFIDENQELFKKFLEENAPSKA